MNIILLLFDGDNLVLLFFKGHAAPMLYAAWAEAGLFDVEDLLKLRTLESDLEGHPTPVCTNTTFMY